MKSILVALDCPQCLYKTHKKSETLVMPDFEPALREALLEGTFFQKKCPRCGKTLDYIHFLLYVDKANHFILMIKPRSDFKEADQTLFHEEEHSLKRYIGDTAEVAEKIHILEDHLDDRAIAILKTKLLIRARKRGLDVQELTYHDRDKKSSTLWFDQVIEGEHQLFAVTMDSYYQITKQLPPLSYTLFEEVNITWGINYLKQQNNK